MELLKQTIQTIIKNIIQYRQLLNLIVNKNQKHIENQNMRQQLSYQIEGILYKIQIDLEEVHSFLEFQEFKQLGEIIKLLFNFLKEGWGKYKQIKFIHQNMGSKSIETLNQIVCCECKDAIQKKQINRLKQKIGLTEGTQTPEIKQQKMTRILKSEILKELSQNSLQQNSKFHISNLESHLSSLLNTIQKSTECKTFNFLYSNQSVLPEQHSIKLEQQKNISNEIQKYLQQIQQNSTQQFVTKLIKQLKVPLRQGIKRLYYRAKQQKYHQNHVEASVQTINQLDQKGKPLIGKFFQLKNELTNVKFSKLKTQNTVKNLQQIQKELRTQLEFQKQKSSSLNQKIINFQREFNAMENKFIYESNNKKIQILRLQKIIKQLEQKRQKKQQASQSKKSTKSIKGNYQNKVTSKKIEKQKYFKSRPSVDFSIFQDIQESNVKNFSKYLPSSNKKVVNFTRRGSKNSNFVPKFQVNHQTPRKQNPISFLYSQSNKQSQQIFKKIKQFQIISQINFSYNPVKIQQSKNNFQQKDKKKSIKYKLYKKYQNQFHKTQKDQSKTLIFSERKSFVNKKPTNKYYEQKLFQKKHNKTQSHQILQQIWDIPKTTSRVKRIGTTLFQNKTKIVKQKSIEKKIINEKILPQLKKSDICLFGDEKTALEYEKQVGQWPKFATDDKLVIDLQNIKFIGEIIKYFRYLHVNCPQKYKQYLQFLQFPVSFLQMKKNKKPINQINNLLLNNITQIQKDDKQKVFQAVKIKQIFIKITRFHRIHHKNCRHVQQFLKMIKFYQF